MSKKRLKIKTMSAHKSMGKFTVLIIFIIFSIILGLMILGLYLKDSSSIILFSLGFGLANEIYLIYVMIKSLKSEVKWSVILDFNYYHEGIFELIFIIIVIIIGIIAIIEL